MSLANLLSEYSRLLLGSLVKAGVRDAVISPGSRSTPFALAAFNTQNLRCHSILDERSAGFFALGQARASGVPSLLICTSGTAAANYYPAVIEASLAHVPLIVLSADRPFELQDCRAAQCIDQLKLFGDFCRRFVELGLPDADPGSLVALQRVAQQTVLQSRFPTPGPVHINARARKPLEPKAAQTEAELALKAQVDALLARAMLPLAMPRVRAHGTTLQSIAQACASARRGIIACGPAAATSAASSKAIFELAALTGFPVFCEATSQLRFTSPGKASTCDGFDWLLRANRFRSEHAPELVLCFGDPLTSSSFEKYLTEHCPARFVFAEHGYPDPQSTSQAVVPGEPGESALELSHLLRELALTADVQGARQSWKLTFERANQTAWQIVERDLADDASLSEGKAVKTVLQAMPDVSQLFLGNSLPIREVDSFVRATERGFSVLHQRGANGIDGLISGALGAASQSSAPTLLLLGDVSFLHDLGGLLAARERTTPLVIAVIDNNGGRIFEQLPVQQVFEADAQLEKLWLTPHGLDFSHAAALYGVRYEAPETAEQLSRAVGTAATIAGATIVHIRVPPHSAREQLMRITQGLEAQLEQRAGR